MKLERWALSDRLDGFYAAERWRGWEAEVSELGPDQVISVWPPIGTDGPNGSAIPIGDRSRRPVPAREQWSFLNDLGQQVTELPQGAAFRVTFTDT